MKPYYHSLVKLLRFAFFFILFLSLYSGPSIQASQDLHGYIVQGFETETVVQLVEKYGGQVTSRLDIIHGVGALLASSSINELRDEPEIVAVSANGSVQTVGWDSAALPKRESWPQTDYPDVVGADYVWQQGITGEGITVAVLDTGISWHPGLFWNTDNKTDNRIAAWVDFIDGSKHPLDPNGHGTHIAGIIANTHKGADGEWNGVAPGVKLAGVRVLDSQGFGTYESVVQGIQWVIEQKETYNIQVLNMSIVAPVQSPYWVDPINQAAMKAWEAGIVVVAAAGNGGPDPLSIGVPGNNPYVVTVGAFTDNYTPSDWNDDYITPFSAAGPTRDRFVKPDLVAPGGHIVSTMHSGAFLIREHQVNKVSQFYFSMAGTSQSAAVVSGVTALVRAANPDLTPDQVKFRLMYTALPWVDPETEEAGYSMWQQGAGRVNAPDAVFAEVEGSANFGMVIGMDLADTIHYEGFSIQDEVTGTYRLNGGYGNWSGGYGNWSGTYGNWSGGFGNWSGGFGNWSGGFGNWSGGFGNWSGGFGNWSGSIESWTDGYGNWSGSLGGWPEDSYWAGALKLQEWVNEKP